MNRNLVLITVVTIAALMAFINALYERPMLYKICAGAGLALFSILLVTAIKKNNKNFRKN